MAFGDVRKCPVCPAYWIEDNQMYINPDVCPECGADAGDYMNEYARGKAGNLSRELLLNPGFEYFAGVIDDGRPNTFENWTNAYVNESTGKIVEAVSDCVEGGASVKMSSGGSPVRVTQNVYDPLISAGGNFRISFWSKGDGNTCYASGEVVAIGGTGLTYMYAPVDAIWNRFQVDLTITACDYIRYRFAPGGSGTRYCFVDACSLKKILT